MNQTFEQTVDAYLLRWHANLRPATLEGKRRVLMSFVQFLRAKHPSLNSFEQVRRDPHIQNWLQSAPHLKASTRQWRLGNLQRFFEDLIAWGWPQAPPRDLLVPEDRPPHEVRLPKPLPPDLDRALQQELARMDTLPALGLRLLRLSGLRIGELLALRTDAFEMTDVQTGSLRVPLGKTHTERIIPLEARGVALLKAIVEQRGTRRPIPPEYTGYLMVDSWGRWLKAWAYRSAFRRLGMKLGTSERLYPHRLRHSFATEMARTNMPIPVLMTLLGHKSPHMTMKYVEVAQVDIRLAYREALGKIPVLNILEAPPMVQTGTLTDTPPDPLDLADALIARVEVLRRDTSDPAQNELLHRFIKRMRKAREDLSLIC